MRLFICLATSDDDSYTREVCDTTRSIKQQKYKEPKEPENGFLANLKPMMLEV